MIYETLSFSSLIVDTNYSLVYIKTWSFQYWNYSRQSRVLTPVLVTREFLLIFLWSFPKVSGTYRHTTRYSEGRISIKETTDVYFRLKIFNFRKLNNDKRECNLTPLLKDLFPLLYYIHPSDLPFQRLSISFNLDYDSPVTGSLVFHLFSLFLGTGTPKQISIQFAKQLPLPGNILRDPRTRGVLCIPLHPLDYCPIVGQWWGIFLLLKNL